MDPWGLHPGGGPQHGPHGRILANIQIPYRTHTENVYYGRVWTPTAKDLRTPIEMTELNSLWGFESKALISDHRKSPSPIGRIDGGLVITLY